jgi:hypothetical protein
MIRVRKLHAAGALIIVAWLCSLGWLVRREYFGGPTPGSVTASQRVSAGAAFFAVYLGERQVGTASTVVDTPPGAVRVGGRLDVVLPDGARERQVRIVTEATLTPSLTLRTLSMVQTGDDPDIGVRGAVEGDGLLTLVRSVKGTAAVDTLRRLYGGALPREALPIRLMHADRPAAGDLLDLSILDVQSGRDHPATVTVSAETTMVVVDSAAFDSATGRWVAARLDTLQAWRLDERGRDGTVRTWVDRQGFVVRAETAEGLVLERTAFEIASNNFQAGKAAAFAGAPEVRLPPRIATDAPTARDTMAELLIPSESPAVLSMSRRLRGPDSDPDGTARTIFRWVSREIGRVPRRGRPRALTALATRRGDDVSRALLYVALLRAQGIPARTVTGVAPGASGWEPRVWAEVGLGAWTPVDPATGDWPADTALVRLRTGGAGHPMETLPLAWRLGPPPSSATERP